MPPSERQTLSLPGELHIIESEDTAIWVDSEALLKDLEFNFSRKIQRSTKIWICHSSVLFVVDIADIEVTDLARLRPYASH